MRDTLLKVESAGTVIVTTHDRDCPGFAETFPFAYEHDGVVETMGRADELVLNVKDTGSPSFNDVESVSYDISGLSPRISEEEFPLRPR